MRIKKPNFIARVRLYLGLLATIFILLSINSYNHIKNETTFTPQTSYAYNDNIIKTSDGRTLVFSESIPPKHIFEYVGVMKNDSIISYRRKMTTIAEFVYLFGAHEPYSEYRSVHDEEKVKNLNQIKTETYDAKHRNSELRFSFWLFIVGFFCIQLISFFASATIEINGKIYGNKIKFYYVLMRYLTSTIILFYFINYSFGLIFIVLGYLLIEMIVFHFEGDGLSSDMTTYGRGKSLINSKFQRLNESYEMLLNGDDIKPEKKEKKEKDDDYFYI